MSSAVISTTAVLGRPFVFDAETVPEVRSLASARKGTPAEAQESAIARVLQSTIQNQQSKIPPASVVPASWLAIRPAPEMVSSGVPALDALTGGLPRGCLTEICGSASSGRTTVLLAALAAATRRKEFCAVVDASDALDPQSARTAGIELDRLLWVRCGENSPERRNAGRKKPNLVSRSAGCPILAAHFAARACPELAEEVGISSQAKFNFGPKENRMKENPWDQSEHCLEQVLRATDLLLESGGFGLIALDLGDLPSQAARRIPLTTWFRFRRAVEHTPTILLAIEQQAIAGSCSSLLLKLGPPNNLEETMMLDQSESSREAAAFVSPEPALSLSKGRKPWVAAEKWNKSHRACPEQAKRAEGYDTIADGAHVTHPSHAYLLTGFDITAELIRSRMERKFARSVTFESKTVWAG